MNSQKVALISGGMSELGEAVGQRLLSSGFVVVASHSPRNDNAQLWLDDQRASGFDFQACEIDVTDPDSCDAGATDVISRFGRIDVLVNCASVVRDAPLSTLTLDKWLAVRHVCLDGAFHLTHAVLDGMIARGWGRIVNLSSVDAQQGAEGKTAQAAAKSAVHGFTKALALEVAKKGVTVNTVSPGYLDTRRTRRLGRDTLERRILPSIPVGRLGTPQEVAGVIGYLCSDQAAFITGAEFPVNGGQHMS